MKTMNFTKKNIEAIEPPGKGFIDVKDSQRQFLRIRVTSTGNRTFYFVRKFQGKPHYKALGRYPDITIAEARESCDRANTSLVSGENQGRPVKTTFGELFNEYLENHAKPRKKTWYEDEKNYRRYLKGLGNTAVHDITTDQVSRLINKIAKNHGKPTANKNRALLSIVFNYAIKKRGMKIDNPCAGIELFREQSRERFLDKSELQRFFQAVSDEATPQVWQDFFLLCLWTGARRGNVQAMRWENIDLENQIWRISGAEFKNQDDFTVVLIEPALEILTRRKFENNGESPFVFPSKSKSGHVMEPKKVWWDILKRAGLKDVRLHDLRRTLGSWQAATGASLQVIGKTLGHRNQSTTAIYARLNLDPVRESLTTAAAAMREAMNGDEK